jgi:hypothetical protein
MQERGEQPTGDVSHPLPGVVEGPQGEGWCEVTRPADVVAQDMRWHGAFAHALDSVTRDLDECDVCVRLLTEWLAATR